MTKKKRKSNAGAKGKFHRWITPDGLTQLEAWARDGLVDAQIATKMGIATGTLYDYKNRFPELDDALKRGKEVIDAEVENMLLKRAMGYEFEERKTIVEDVDGVKKQKIEKVNKHITPDVTAQIFWLKNRKPNEWRDKREHEHTGQVDSSIDYSGFSESELRKLADKLNPED